MWTATDYFHLSIGLLILCGLTFVWAERELRYRNDKANGLAEIIAGLSLFGMILCILIGHHAMGLMEETCSTTDSLMQMCCIQPGIFEP